MIMTEIKQRQRRISHRKNQKIGKWICRWPSDKFWNDRKNKFHVSDLRKIIKARLAVVTLI